MTPQTYVLRTEDTAITTGVAFHIPTETHTYICIFSEIFTGILEEFSVSANWSCRKKFPNASLLSNCQIAQFVISDDSNEYSPHNLRS